MSTFSIEQGNHLRELYNEIARLKERLREVSPHHPVPAKGLNLGFTHRCSICGAYFDGKMWAWDVAPADDFCLGPRKDINSREQ